MTEAADHEAAHLVVGCALGLRVRRATARETFDRGVLLGGYVDWFTDGGARRREAMAIMFAAGIAHDRRVNAPADSSAYDLKYCRELCSGAHGVETCVRAAQAILHVNRRLVRVVSAALDEGDLTGRHIAALARGEEIET